jgi:hypothetical protein
MWILGTHSNDSRGHRCSAHIYCPCWKPLYFSELFQNGLDGVLSESTDHKVWVYSVSLWVNRGLLWSHTALVEVFIAPKELVVQCGTDWEARKGDPQYYGSGKTPESRWDTIYGSGVWTRGFMLARQGLLLLEPLHQPKMGCYLIVCMKVIVIPSDWESHFFFFFWQYWGVNARPHAC